MPSKSVLMVCLLCTLPDDVQGTHDPTRQASLQPHTNCERNRAVPVLVSVLPAHHHTTRGTQIVQGYRKQYWGEERQLQALEAKVQYTSKTPPSGIARCPTRSHN